MRATQFSCVCAMSQGLALAMLLALPADAAWPTDPTVNVPLCTATYSQSYPRAVSDGAGGAIVTWQDIRGGPTGADVYAQRVLVSGAVDPAWPADGLAVCNTAAGQQYPEIVPDGAGGAIIAWQDTRGGTVYDIYAQHVLADGTVDPAWPANGRALSSAGGSQQNLLMASDDAGGAIVTWTDYRSAAEPTFYSDLYAQHVLASGAVDPAWPADGRAVCTQVGNQFPSGIIPDGAGGAIVTWYDHRSGTSHDIYAQHLLAGGAADPAWPADGRALCTAVNDQNSPRIISYGSEGWVVTWYDYRSGTDFDIYAQHMLASGAVDPAWPADGLAICTAANDQYAPMLASDGAGGAIITWGDHRNGMYNSDIFAQHLLASGAVDPAWPADGRALCTAASDQQSPEIVSDGAEGAIVTWSDRRGGWDVYAQHLLAGGAVDPAWPADGRALSIAANDQYDPRIVSDGAGGAVVAWQDYRLSTTYPHIYAQRVLWNGRLGGDNVSVPGEAALAFALDPVRPNPTREGALTVHFGLAIPGAASLEVFDVAGHRIAAREVGSLGAGRHTLDLGAGRHLAPGLYLVRLRQGMSSRVSRVVVLE